MKQQCHVIIKEKEKRMIPDDFSTENSKTKKESLTKNYKENSTSSLAHKYTTQRTPSIRFTRRRGVTAHRPAHERRTEDTKIAQLSPQPAQGRPSGSSVKVSSDVGLLASADDYDSSLAAAVYLWPSPSLVAITDRLHAPPDRRAPPGRSFSILICSGLRARRRPFSVLRVRRRRGAPSSSIGHCCTL